MEPEPEPELELEPAPPLTPPLEPLSDALDAPTPLVRWLSIHGAASGRKQALELLQGGGVAVNGEPCTTPARLIQSSRDEVSCSGEAVVPQCRHRHVLLHKPAGHVTARRSVRQLKGGGVEDDGRPSVYSLLDPETQARHCVAVGRLDVDTTGALLFTSNGMLAHYLLVPHFHVAKLYRATLRTAEPLSEAAIEQLARGVTLRTKAQTLCRGSARNVAGRPGVVELEIDGGAFHQVRKNAFLRAILILMKTANICQDRLRTQTSETLRNKDVSNRSSTCWRWWAGRWRRCTAWRLQTS